MPPLLSNLTARPLWQQWSILLLLSVVFVVLMELANIPAALLLGSMLAGIIIGCKRSTIRMPQFAFRSAQTIIGCLIASALSPKIIELFAQSWWLITLVILSAIVAACSMGYVLAKRKIIEGSTAVWGTMPGAASTMVIMSDEFGADMRMVAFMQYLRVLLTSITASLVALFIVPDSAQTATHLVWTLGWWFPPIDLTPFSCTLLIAISGYLITTKLRIPGGYLLLPMTIGGILHGLGVIDFQLPQWLLGICYAILGWRIGLSFDIDSLRHAYKVLPHVLLSIILLMLFCGLLAWLLIFMYDVDPLTAYLATSPGGMDTIAVIVASRPYADMSFVMALQIARLLILNLICPPLAKWLGNYTTKPPAATKK